MVLGWYEVTGGSMAKICDITPVTLREYLRYSVLKMRLALKKCTIFHHGMIMGWQCYIMGLSYLQSFIEFEQKLWGFFIQHIFDSVSFFITQSLVFSLILCTCSILNRAPDWTDNSVWNWSNFSNQWKVFCQKHRNEILLMVLKIKDFPKCFRITSAWSFDSFHDLVFSMCVQRSHLRVLQNT